MKACEGGECLRHGLQSNLCEPKPGANQLMLLSGLRVHIGACDKMDKAYYGILDVARDIQTSNARGERVATS